MYDKPPTRPFASPAVDLMKHPRLAALLIDIDETIIRFREPYRTDSLFGVLESAAAQLAGLTREEIQNRIQRIKTEMRWWHWSDFIVALELNPKQFWNYAAQHERAYIEPTGPEILGALERLRNAGILLYVTSNNPSSGILHKLSLAGLATLRGAPLFSQLLGCTEMHAMKWEPLYWKKVLAHIGLDAEEVAVVGDNPCDDCSVPHSIGITHTFLINRQEDPSAENSECLTHVTDFNQIADCVLSPRSTQSRFALSQAESVCRDGLALASS